MTTATAVHQCLFCTEVFSSAAAKDDHILEHFAQEMCDDCNQNLIRVGSNLYTLHNAVTCIKDDKSDIKIKAAVEQCKLTNDALCKNQYDVSISETPSVASGFEEILIKLEPEEVDDQRDQSKQPENIDTKLPEPIEPSFPSECNEVQVIEDEIIDTEVQEITLPDEILSESAATITEATQTDENEKSTLCDACGEPFDCEQLLENHKKLKHTTAEVVAANTIEGDNFDDKFIGIETEIETETEIDDIELPTQSQGNMLPVDLLSETTIAEPDTTQNDTEENIVLCDVCLQPFSCELFMESHKRLEHNEQPENIDFQLSDANETSLLIEPNTIEVIDVGIVVAQIVEDEFINVPVIETETETETQTGTDFNVQEISLPEELLSEGITSMNASNVNDSIEKSICDICSESFDCELFMESHKRLKHATVDVIPAENLNDEVIEEVVIAIETDYKILNETQENMLPEELLSETTIAVPDTTQKATVESSILCNICGESFECELYMESHKRITHTKIEENKAKSKRSHKKSATIEEEEEEVFCDICNRPFRSKQFMENHKILIHADDSPTIKLKRGRKKKNWASSFFASQSNQEVISAIKKVFCDVCGQPIDSELFLESHKKLKHSKNSKSVGKNQKIYRKLCGEAFNDQLYLDSHKKLKHSDTNASNKMKPAGKCNVDGAIKRMKMEGKLVKTFECMISNKMYATDWSLRTHIETIHNPTARKFPCKLCDLAFFRRCALQVHHEQVHLNLKNFICSICDVGLKSKAALERHMCKHTGKKPVKCSWQGCNKTFSCSSNRDEHMRSHTGEQPFECTIDGCDKRFTFAADFRRHKYVVHNVFTKKFPCEFCTEIFPQQAMLKKHVQSKHKKSV